MTTSFPTIDKERGAAALELAMAAPLFVLFMALCLDVGVYVHYATTANSAASAAIRYITDHPGQAENESAIRHYLDEAYSELAFEGGASTVTVLSTSSSRQAYTYHMYDGNTLVEFPATYDHDHVRVTVTTTTPWPALGFLLNKDGGTFTVMAVREGDADRTDGSTW